MKSANDSLSHESSHHFIVTRSPNHMCAISCAIVEATHSRSSSVGVPWVRASSRKTTQPGNSIAPQLSPGAKTCW